jgi:hypothetical protein
LNASVRPLPRITVRVFSAYVPPRSNTEIPELLKVPLTLLPLFNYRVPDSMLAVAWLVAWETVTV